MDFSNKLYIYFDAASLRDPGAVHLMETLAEHYCQLILYVRDVWEEEALKKLPAYAYICRTVYETDLNTVLAKDSVKRTQGNAKHILLFTASQQNVEGIEVVQLQNHRGMEQILQEKQECERKRKRIVSGICIGCVLYFLLYFLFLNRLPQWMQDGGIAFICCLLPAEILMLTIIYGIRKRVIPFGAVFEFLDFFG